MKEKWLNQIRALGPGLLWAGAAIGVSHLVQSTRAGAIYGFSLVGIVLIANILKYPFFEYGPRYAAATGKSLLDGYRELGNWAMVIFLLLTFGTMFTIQAAVTIVTSGLAAHLFGVSLTPFIWSVLILSRLEFFHFCLSCDKFLFVLHYVKKDFEVFFDIVELMM